MAISSQTTLKLSSFVYFNLGKNRFVENALRNQSI